jgi:hypothetical protein
VHGNNDIVGAANGVDKVATGLSLSKDGGTQLCLVSPNSLWVQPQSPAEHYSASSLAI